MSDEEILDIEKELNEEDPFDEQVEDFFALMTEFTEGQRQFNATILKDLDTIKQAIALMIKDPTKKKETHFKHVEAKPGRNLEEAPKPEFKKAYPGIPVEEGGGHKTVVEYTKKDGTIGHKATKDIIFEDKFHKYLQECKYGCGCWISFDNYKKGMKALHIEKGTLKPIGRFCPKYE